MNDLNLNENILEQNENCSVKKNNYYIVLIGIIVVIAAVYFCTCKNKSQTN